MNKKLFLLTALLLIGIMPFVNAEINMYNSVIKDNNLSVVRHHLLYSLEDTSIDGVGRNKDVEVYLYYLVQALPYDLSLGGFSGEVDWCNLTTYHFRNIYNEEGFLLNTTTDTQSIYFGTGGISSSFLQFKLRSRDVLIADIDCHYTDVNSLYADNVLVGRFTTYIPSYECKGCSDYTIEELSNQVEKSEEITANELLIYNGIQKAVNWNFQIWLILSWVIKIAFVGIGIYLIFLAGYYFYYYLNDIAKQI